MEIPILNSNWLPSEDFAREHAIVFQALEQWWSQNDPAPDSNLPVST